MTAAKSLTQLRAGVIGTGFIGPVHIEALRRLGVTVAALCDVPQLVHAMAARHAIPRTFTDYRELLASPDIDVVHITAPNRFHKEMSLAALRAGKHCVCEKPLAMDTQETAQIAKLARSSGTVFAVNYNVRFYPAVLQLRRLVAGGGLGEIIHVNGSYMQDWLFKDTDYNWRLLPKEGGKLRAVADIGTHWMDTASFILGAKIGSVFATLDTFHKTRRRPLGEVQTFSKAEASLRYASYKVQTEDFASVLLRFANGAMGNLAVSQVAAGRKNCLRIEIYGSKKSAWWCSERPRCCASVIATSPTKLPCAPLRPSAMAPPAIWIFRPATSRDFQTLSRWGSGISISASPAAARARPCTPPPKTATGKLPSVKPSWPATVAKHGQKYENLFDRGLSLRDGFKVAAEPFADLSFGAASHKAAQSGKIVLVDFYTTWCGPCKMLDKNTWTDPAVIKALEDKTVALRIDAEKETGLSKRYKIEAYPSVLLIKPDGTELDRLVGYREPKTFLADFNASLNGKDSLTRAKETLNAAGTNDPSARMQYGQTLAQKGKDAEALQEYLWCFDHGNEASPAFVGVRLSFLLSDIKNLGRNYPAAIQALQVRRDERQAKVLAGQKDRASVMELTRLNDALDQSEKNLALFDQLPTNSPSRTFVASVIVDQLLAAKRYADVLGGKDGKSVFAAQVKQFNGMMTFMKASPQKEQLEGYMRQSTVAVGAHSFEALAGLKRDEEAKALAQDILKFDSSAETHTTLAQAASEGGNSALAEYVKR